MEQFFENLFSTKRYTSLIQKERARVIYSITGLILVVLTVFVLAYHPAGGGGPQPIQVALFYATAIACYVLTRMGRLTVASAILLIANELLIGFSLLPTGLYSLTHGMLLCTMLMLAVLLLERNGLIIGVISVVIILFAGIQNRQSARPPTSADPASDVLIALVNISVQAGVAYLLLRNARLSSIEGTAVVRGERLRLAEITSQVSQRISRRMALDQVLDNAVEQIRYSYPYIYHAQIFLLDEHKEAAKLVASTGPVGRMLLERQHSLPVGSASVIGQVTSKGQAVIARANSADGIHKRNEFLPDTLVEAAFPLRLGDDIIGALDMQSKVADPFDDEVVPIFQSLADQIAIAIDNARLFEETERRLQENQKLVEQMRRSNEEVERLNQQLTGHFWQEYLRERKRDLGVEVDFEQRSRQADPLWTPTLRDAARFNHLVQQKQDGSQVIAVPLRVRGQVIGAMEFELDASGNLAPEDLNLLEEVSEQLGLAAETSRLFEGSQRAAQREALVNEIATRLQSSNNVEMTLTEAARSLKNTLKANRVAIRLGAPPKTS
jgi:GAF domain-containing protein